MGAYKLDAKDLVKLYMKLQTLIEKVETGKTAVLKPTELTVYEYNVIMLIDFHTINVIKLN